MEEKEIKTENQENEASSLVDETPVPASEAPATASQESFSTPSSDSSDIQKQEETKAEVTKEENPQDKKSEKRKKRYKSLLPYVCVLVPCIAIGVVVGVFAKKLFSGDEGTDYSDIDTQKLYPDYDKIGEAYKKAQGIGDDFTKTLTPTQMAASAFYLIQNESHVYSQGIGAAGAMGVTQNIRSTTIQDGDKYFEESLSLSSFVDIADRMYQVPNDDDYTVTMHLGKTKGSVDVGEYDEAGTAYTGEEYIAHMGRLLSTPTSYIVSDKTVLTTDKTADMYGTTSSTKNGDGTYTVEIELDPKLGVSAYVVQMQTISDLVSKPTFYYCHLTFELDKDLNLLSIYSHEYYHAVVKQMGMKVNSDVTGEMRVVYERGGDYKIPALDEPCGYRSAM